MATARRTSTRGAGAAAAPARSSGYRGSAGLRKMEEEHERQEAQREASKNMMGAPFRFFCPVGESREIVIVDEEPDFFRYEHNLKNNRSGRWDIFTACINENANCPVCKNAERPSYFAMYLTIIDLTPYETRDGDQVPWSKKLLVVKSAQQKKIVRLYERHKSLRGMILQMTRDGEKDASIGNDIEFVEFMSEEDLETYESEYTDQNGKVHEVLGMEVFDYDELFPEPTEQSLRAIVGGKAEAGSREEDDREHGSARGRAASRARGTREAEDDAPAERSRPARGASRGRTAEVDPDEQEVEQEERPARGRAASTRAAAGPTRGATRTASRGRPAAEEVEAEAEDDAPQRGRATSRRAAPPDDDAPPPRQSLAERRRALRR